MTKDTKDEFAVQDEAEMQEIHEFDFQRAVGLMMIAEKVATVAPKCTSLLGIAQAELEAMNAQAKDIARRRAERAKEAEARKAAAEAEKAEQVRLAAEGEGTVEWEKAQMAAKTQPRVIPAKPTPEPDRRA